MARMTARPLSVLKQMMASGKITCAADLAKLGNEPALVSAFGRQNANSVLKLQGTRTEALGIHFHEVDSPQAVSFGI